MSGGRKPDGSQSNQNKASQQLVEKAAVCRGDLGDSLCVRAVSYTPSIQTAGIQKVQSLYYRLHTEGIQTELQTAYRRHTHRVCGYIERRVCSAHHRSLKQMSLDEVLLSIRTIGND